MESYVRMVSVMSAKLNKQTLKTAPDLFYPQKCCKSAFLKLLRSNPRMLFGSLFICCLADLHSVLFPRQFTFWNFPSQPLPSLTRQGHRVTQRECVSVNERQEMSFVEMLEKHRHTHPHRHTHGWTETLLLFNIS